MTPTVPFPPRVAARGMVAAADQLACSAGIAMLDGGGSAADAMVAAAAVMAVVGPHLCGLGGDVLAMVKAPGDPPVGLLAVGRAGSGADPDRLRADGHADMPLRGDIRSVPVPGAVDGWLALHGRYGRLAWATVLEPAIVAGRRGLRRLVDPGLRQSPGRRRPRAPRSSARADRSDPGQLVRLPGIARTLRDLATGGRDGFYGGEFGRALLDLGGGGVHGRRSGAAPGAVDGTADAACLRPRSLDRPPTVAGLRHPRRRLDRRARSESPPTAPTRCGPT